MNEPIHQCWNISHTWSDTPWIKASSFHERALVSPEPIYHSENSLWLPGDNSWLRRLLGNDCQLGQSEAISDAKGVSLAVSSPIDTVSSWLLLAWCQFRDFNYKIEVTCWARTRQTLKTLLLLRRQSPTLGHTEPFHSINPSLQSHLVPLKLCQWRWKRVIQRFLNW